MANLDDPFRMSSIPYRNTMDELKPARWARGLDAPSRYYSSGERDINIDYSLHISDAKPLSLDTHDRAADGGGFGCVTASISLSAHFVAEKLRKDSFLFWHVVRLTLRMHSFRPAMVSDI